MAAWSRWRAAEQCLKADDVIDETAVALAQARKGLVCIDSGSLHCGLSVLPAA